MPKKIATFWAVRDERHSDYISCFKNRPHINAGGAYDEPEHGFMFSLYPWATKFIPALDEMKAEDEPVRVKIEVLG
jgi:hypothetical protein